MSLRTQAAKRRSSFLEVESNPFESKEDSSGSVISIESLADTVKIQRDDLNNLLSILEGLSDNQARIRTLHNKKTPYLFSSDDLIELLKLTASVKTKIAFISEIGPRLTDPKAKSAEIIDMFRYSEEKRQVEEVLKARAQTVAKQSTFSRPMGNSVLSGGRGGGAGGRGAGRGGRGRGAGGRGGSGRGSAAVSTKPAVQQASPEKPSTSQVNSPTSPPVSNRSGGSGRSQRLSMDSIAEGEETGKGKNTEEQIGRRVSRPSARNRRSSLTVSQSVMKSLDLGSVNDITLEGVPMELWEVKARKSSNAVEITLNEEDKLRGIAASSLNRNETTSEASSRPIVNKNLENDCGKQPESISKPTTDKVTPEATIDRMEPTSSCEPAADKPEPISEPVPEKRAEPSSESTAEKEPESISDSATDSKDPEPNSESAGDNKESERSIVSSTEKEPEPTNKPAADNKGPESTNESAATIKEPESSSETTADKELEPVSESANNKQPETSDVSPTGKQATTEGDEGVLGWVRRRMSSANAQPVVHTPIDDAPSENHTESETVKAEISTEKDSTPAAAAQTTATASVDSTGVEENGSPTSAQKNDGFFTRVVRRISTPGSKVPVDEQKQDRNRSKTVDSPPKGGRPTTKEPRTSLQMLLEEKKVGNIRGFFENLVGSKKSDADQQDVSPRNKGGSSIAVSAASPTDDRMQQYIDMVPEKSIGVDPDTGRELYSYHELVRRNYMKSYDGVTQSELEEHLSDGEFLVRFNMTKAEFRAMPKWRRTERKKNLMLF